MEKHLDFDKEFETLMQKHQLDTVVLCAHMNPDGDAAGSVMSLAHYIRVNYPQYRVFPYLSEKLDRGPKKQVLDDLIFDPFAEPDVQGQRYLAIACDTATMVRMIGREYYEAAVATMTIDHHAANEGYGDVNYVRISEACSENIFYAMDPEKLKKAAEESYPNVADYLYLGILHDTSNFSRANVTILNAGAKLLELGVEHKRIVKTTQMDTLSDVIKRSELLKRAKRAVGGKVAYVFITQEESRELNVGYEDIHPISGYLRDCEDIAMAFSMYEEEKDIWRCSFRSDGEWIDVNELMQPFGGGGHKAASGLRKPTTEPEKLRDEVIARIEQMTGTK